MAVETTVYFNPGCSKCRTTQSLLRERGVGADYVEYLRQAPTVEKLRRVMGLLGIDDPRAMMRTAEPVYTELALDQAGPDQLLDAITLHPILLERPIVIRGDRAVIARPADKVLSLLEDAPEGG